MSQWRRVRLKHLAAIPIVNGVGEPGEYEEPDWPRYVRTTDIAGPSRLRDDVFKSLPPGVASRAPLAHGDVVMVAAGATIGKLEFYRWMQHRGWCGIDREVGGWRRGAGRG